MQPSETEARRLGVVSSRCSSGRSQRASVAPIFSAMRHPRPEGNLGVRWSAGQRNPGQVGQRAPVHRMRRGLAVAPAGRRALGHRASLDHPASPISPSFPPTRASPCSSFKQARCTSRGALSNSSRASSGSPSSGDGRAPGAAGDLVAPTAQAALGLGRHRADHSGRVGADSRQTPGTRRLLPVFVGPTDTKLGQPDGSAWRRRRRATTASSSSRRNAR